MKVGTKVYYGITILAILIAVGIGCQTSSTPVAPSRANAPSTIESTPGIESKALLDLDSTAPVLSQALAHLDVAAARQMLESEGYHYVDTNSLVLIHVTGDDVPSTFSPASLGSRDGSQLTPRRSGRVDTIAWLAFENPVHDPGNHTAVLQFSNGIKSGTFLIELDITGPYPSVIRQGYFEDGAFHDGDIGTETWLACMAGGFAGTIVRCSMTNCGFGHCMGAGAFISLAGCTAVSLWNWMNS